MCHQVLALKIRLTAVEREELSPLEPCWESQLRLSSWTFTFLKSKRKRNEEESGSASQHGSVRVG